MSAQSWPGLGATEDERYRIAATADGGIFVLGTPHPEPLVALAGKRRVLETAHRLVGGAWGDEATTREQRARVAEALADLRDGRGDTTPLPVIPAVEAPPPRAVPAPGPARTVSERLINRWAGLGGGS